MAPRDTTSYNNQSKQTMAGAKLLILGEINIVETGTPNLMSTVCATATPQEIMYSPTGNFVHQGGASWDCIVSPFQIGGTSPKLPTMPASASPACVVSQSNHVDPPINEWTPPVIDISYLNPFLRAGSPSHGAGSRYDGTVVFNGGTNSDQNLVNAGSVPADLRPMALRGPLVIQGWGYDLNGKPIPNKADDADNARQGDFVSTSLKDQFLDKWTEKRETWPVAPVDLRYDRVRKVWTVPSTFRIIQVKATGGVPAGASVTDCEPLNIDTVYKSDGTTVSSPKITVTNPSWNANIESGESFFAFYDTKDCTYYPLAASGGGGSGGSGIKIIDSTFCDSSYSPSITTCQDVTGCIAFGNGLGVVNDGGGDYTVNALYYISSAGAGRCDGASDITKTYFNHLKVGSGLQATDNGDCSFTIEGCNSKIAANTYCGGKGNTVIETTLDLVTFEHGFYVTPEGGNNYKVDNDLRIGGNRFYNIVPRTGLTLTAFGNCEYYLDATSVCQPTVVGGTDIEVVTATDPDGCKEFTVNWTGCETEIIGGTGIGVTKDECTYTIDYNGCHTIIAADPDSCIVVTDSWVDCHEYLIGLDEDCIRDLIPTPESYAWSLCGSTVNSGDNITFSTVGCASVDCSYGAFGYSHNVEITVSGTTITAGTGIQVTDDGSCGYTINAEFCNTIVSTTDPCLIVTGPSPGLCPEYFIEIKQSCKDVWEERPSWEFCGTVVEDGDAVTFTEAGCVSLNCVGHNLEIDVPCTEIAGGHCIDVVKNGDNDFTISVTGSCTGGGGSCTHEGTTNVAFVSDVCCVGSGLDIKYGSMTFVDGCFSGYSTTGC